MSEPSELSIPFERGSAAPSALVLVLLSFSALRRGVIPPRRFAAPNCVETKGVRTRGSARISPLSRGRARRRRGLRHRLALIVCSDLPQSYPHWLGKTSRKVKSTQIFMQFCPDRS